MLTVNAFYCIRTNNFVALPVARLFLPSITFHFNKFDHTSCGMQPLEGNEGAGKVDYNRNIEREVFEIRYVDRRIISHNCA